MKKSFISIAVLILFFFLYANNNFAQELSHGSWGFSAVVNSSQADILIPIFLDNYNSISPSIGVVNASEINTDISAGIVYHHYLEYSKNFSPILGLRVGGIFGSPNGGTSTSDFIVGGLAGGEYFFSKNFSVGIEVQLNLAISDNNSARFGNPGGTNFNTGSVLFGAIYF